MPAIAAPPNASRSKRAHELMKALGRAGWRVGTTRRFGGGFLIEAWRTPGEYLRGEGDDLAAAVDEVFTKFHEGRA